MLYTFVDNKIYIKNWIAGVMPNKFGLSPIYYPNLNVKDELTYSLQIGNPYMK